MKRISLLIAFLMTLGWVGISKTYAESDIETVNLAFTIAPTTVLKANQSAASANVFMGPVIPGVKTDSESLEISVVTNSNDAYRVYHSMRGEMTSSSGGEFPREELAMSVSHGSAGGKSEFAGAASAPYGRTLIFTSNGDGDSDSFTINYSLVGEKTFSAGNYYGNIYLDVEIF